MAFKTDWSTYSPLDIGQTFFSDSKMQESKNIYLFDGVKLFPDNILKEEDLNKNKNPIKFYLYTTSDKDEVSDMYKKVSLRFNEVSVFFLQTNPGANVFVSVKLDNQLLQESTFHGKYEMEEFNLQVSLQSINNLRSVGISHTTLIQLLNTDKPLFKGDAISSQLIMQPKAPIETPAKNPKDFNPNRIVVWLNGYILGLPQGLKLIRLEPKNEKDIYTNCIYWGLGDYHFTPLPNEILYSTNVFLSNISGRALQNDILHLLRRISSYKTQQPEFNKVVEIIKKFASQELSEDDIKSGLSTLSSKLKFNPWASPDKPAITDEGLKDKPALINIYQKVLSDVYNPKINESTLFFDEILIVPLSIEWFFSDAKMKVYYNETWRKHLIDIFAYSAPEGQREAGETISRGDSEDYFEKVKTELLNLKAKVVETTLVFSSESQWLQTLSNDLFNKIRTIMFLHDGVWKLSNYDRYAEGIAIENSFGAFRLPPLLNVILHELKVSESGTADNYLTVSNTHHISKGDTEQMWTKANTGKFSEVKQSEDFMDMLYQSQRAYATIALGVILNEI